MVLGSLQETLERRCPRRYRYATAQDKAVACCHDRRDRPRWSSADAVSRHPLCKERQVERNQERRRGSLSPDGSGSAKVSSSAESSWPAVVVADVAVLVVVAFLAAVADIAGVAVPAVVAVVALPA